MSSSLLPEPLEDLFWREEVTELLFWRELCGLGASADLEEIQRLSPPGAELDPAQLDRLVEDGLLRVGDGTYELTAAGRTRGAWLFVTDPDLPPLRPALLRIPETIADPQVELRALEELRAAIDARMHELSARRAR